MYKKPKLLLLSNLFPYPPDGGGGILFCYEFIQYLRVDFEISIVCFTDSSEALNAWVVSDMCAKGIYIEKPKSKLLGKFVSIFSMRPSSVNKFKSRIFQDEVLKIVQNEKFDIAFTFGIGMEQFLKKVNIPVISAPIDAMSLLYKRRSEHTPNLFKKIVFLWESWRLKRYEINTLSLSALCFVVSEADNQYLKKNGVKNSFYSTNGVDSNYFSPQNNAENFSIVFTGVMDYPPNIDAATYMASEVMPLLAIKYPSIKYFIVGRNPTAEIKKLASENIVVTGYVEDVREYISRASVFVSSLRYGTGIKNKILEAASMAKPIVATSISLEGLKHLQPLVLEANYPAEIVDQISKILDNKKLADRFGAELRGVVENYYSWEATFDVIKNKIYKIINNE